MLQTMMILSILATLRLRTSRRKGSLSEVSDTACIGTTQDVPYYHDSGGAIAGGGSAERVGCG